MLVKKVDERMARVQLAPDRRASRIASGQHGNKGDEGMATRRYGYTRLGGGWA